jgi:hypothetical protein
VQGGAAGGKHPHYLSLGTYRDDENELEREPRPDDLKDVDPQAAEVLGDRVGRDDQRESDECRGNRQQR